LTPRIMTGTGTAQNREILRLGRKKLWHVPGERWR
jgi:hypothetical protein